jgi:hypothetical protein
LPPKIAKPIAVPSAPKPIINATAISAKPMVVLLLSTLS